MDLQPGFAQLSSQCFDSSRGADRRRMGKHPQTSLCLRRWATGFGLYDELVAATRVHDLLDGGLSIIRTLAGMRCNGWRRTHRLCISEFNERRCLIEIMHFGN